MRYAVFITTIALDDENEQPDYGTSIFGLTTEADIIERVQEDFAELNASSGVSYPFLVSEDQLNAIEAALPKENDNV